MPSQQLDLVDSPTLARELGLSPATLAADRQKPKPTFPFVRLSARTVRYSLDTVRKVLAERERGGAQ